MLFVCICKIPKFPPTWTSKFNCIQLSIAVARKHSVACRSMAHCPLTMLTYGSMAGVWTTPGTPAGKWVDMVDMAVVCSRQQLPKLPSKILQAKASHLMSSLMVPKGKQWCTSVPVVDLWWILRCKIKALRNLWTGTIRCLSLAKSYSFLQALSKQGPPNVPCKVCSTVNMLCVCVCHRIWCSIQSWLHKHPMNPMPGDPPVAPYVASPCCPRLKDETTGAGKMATARDAKIPGTACAWFLA